MSKETTQQSAELPSLAIQFVDKGRDLTKSPYHYAILMETSGEECESWMYFIRYEGNEAVLQHLESQLNSVEWYVINDLSTFDLETKKLVSEQTAKEMTLVDLNHTSFHRKFDGKLQQIDFHFKTRYTNEKKMDKVFNMIGYGQIENYIDMEDVDSDAEIEEVEVDSSSDESSSSSEEEKRVKTRKGTTVIKPRPGSTKPPIRIKK